MNTDTQTNTYVKYVYYYDENGNESNEKICSEEHYKNNVKHGPYIGYDWYGSINKKYNYTEGKLHGEFIEYPYHCIYSNEKFYIKKIVGNYTNGKLHGEYIKYYNNNKIALIANYSNGELNGPYICLRANGKMEYKT